MRRLAALLLLAVAATAGAQDARPVVVASKTFTESRLLAEIIAQQLERHGIAVERRAGLGGTTVVFNALRLGEVDVYPEYSGTGWAVHLDAGEAVADPLRVWLTVQREFRRRWDLEWLHPFGFNNTYAIAMLESRAAQLDVRSVSDLARHLDGLRFGVTHEFLNRPDGFPGLARAYALDGSDVRGIEHGLAYEAIRQGEVDVIDAYSTDGRLARFPLRLLTDDRGFFPPYDAAPVVRADALERHPALRGALAALAWRISDARMRELNARAEDSGGDFAAVAAEFLRTEGSSGGRSARAGDTARTFRTFVAARAAPTMRLALEHLGLTLAAVALAVLFSLPLGIVLSRSERAAAPALGVAGVVQTIPSLALLVFMLPLLGLGIGSAIAALFLYALLPLLRNTVAGIRGVDADVTEAGRAIGLTPREILGRIELPLASPTIMAGVRTATVISIGVATLAAFIGAGGLGEPIVTGLQLNDLWLVLSGAVPAALLALVVDGLLGLVERRLRPAGLA